MPCAAEETRSRGRTLSTAAEMPGLLLIMALLSSIEAFRLGPTPSVIPLSPPLAHLFQDDSPTQPFLVQELVRAKRHSGKTLVPLQPHLDHDMGWPEILKTSQVKKDNSSHLIHSSPHQDIAMLENVDVEKMERMVHLVVSQDAGSNQGDIDSTDPEMGFHAGSRAGDSSLEASGFYGTDTEDRDRGEDGLEDKERRMGEERGEEERERDTGDHREMREKDARGEEGDEQDILGVYMGNYSAPGHSPSFDPTRFKQSNIFSPAEVHDSGLKKHHGSAVPEVPMERELWEAEGDEYSYSSGYGLVRSSITTTTKMATALAEVGTATPETNTGTDFGLLEDETELKEAARGDKEETGFASTGVFIQNPTVPEIGMAPSREPLQPSMEKTEEFKGAAEEERHIIPITTDRSPTVSFTEGSWEWLEKTTSPQAQGSEVKGSGATEVFLPKRDFSEKEEPEQVVCMNWSELAGRGYVILNMTQNLNCEEFRVDQGYQLLRVMERVFGRRMNSPEGSWVLYLSKPTHQQHQLLMNVASQRGVIATKDILDMLGEIRKSLNKVGIQNYSAPSSCQSRPSQTRSNYGKLFVVLVIIGSICMVIIASGFIYICWQRRLPATKSMFRPEELHFVENGCHDNPMLDVTNYSQPEMQEKKPSANGLAGGGEGGGAESNRWQVFVNQAATEEEEEEQDTHL